MIPESHALAIASLALWSSALGSAKAAKWSVLPDNSQPQLVDAMLPPHLL